MGEIERWSIERLNESLAKTHVARSGSNQTRARKVKGKSRLVALARVVKYFSGWRKRQAPLAKAG